MLLPFSERAKHWEPLALGLRRLLHLADADLLDPYLLAPKVGLKVVDARDVCVHLDPHVSKHILQTGKDAWSGGVLAEPLPDGTRICILNPTHSPRRRRITLMEEISHVHLRHVPTVLKQQADGIRVRDYNSSQEQEAYGVGAAALLPWNRFFVEINRGMCVEDLAERYQVSRELVEYRIRITAASKLYYARQRSTRHSTSRPRD